MLAIRTSVGHGPTVDQWTHITSVEQWTHITCVLTWTTFEIPSQSTQHVPSEE